MGQVVWFHKWKNIWFLWAADLNDNCWDWINCVDTMRQSNENKSQQMLGSHQSSVSLVSPLLKRKNRKHLKNRPGLISDSFPSALWKCSNCGIFPPTNFQPYFEVHMTNEIHGTNFLYSQCKYNFTNWELFHKA